MLTLSRTLSVGFAIFAMLFGAGNVVYPLILGREIGDKLPFGLAGFIIAAVVIPLIGLVSALLSHGDFQKFLSPLGKIPSNIMTFIFMLLIGPFAFSPRTLTVAYAAINLYVPSLSMFTFGILATVIIYLLTASKSRVMDLLGEYLGPVQLGLLMIVVVKGLMTPMTLTHSTITASHAFLKGLHIAYGTGDLFGTLFFAGLILSSLVSKLEHKKSITLQQIAIMGGKAGLVGALFLAIVYSGFCTVAAFYSPLLSHVSDGEIFSRLTGAVLGGTFGFLANMAVALSCLTTAIALITVFANYFHTTILKQCISYRLALLISIIATVIVSNLGFSGIMQCIGPVLELLYPMLLVLSVVNILHHLYGFAWIKTPVLVTFVVTAYLQYQHCLPF